MSQPSGLPSLGEPADQNAWRELVDAGLKGASWDKLTRKTADGIEIGPLYRESDVATAADEAGFPGAAPFVRGARAGAWAIRQSFAHPDPERTNADILADLAGGVSAIELVIDPKGKNGVAICDAADLDLALADVILDAAPVSLDAGAHGLWAAELLAAKLKGAKGDGVAFNVDPIGAMMRTGAVGAGDVANAAAFAKRQHAAMPSARVLRADARPVHEAGGTEAQEIAAALSAGIAYLRALTEAGLSAGEANAVLAFTISVGPDVLVEASKLRALRLCWARVLEASGAAPADRAAHIHAVTSQRILTRADAWTNILRITTAATGAAIGGADAITTSAFTDALGAPTPFARRVARNTQLVLLEESRLGHVADPAGGSWFVEKLTHDLAATAWTKMQTIEAQGGIVAALMSGSLQKDIATARAAKQKAFAARRESITGVTDFPLLGAEAPKTEAISYTPKKKFAGPAPKQDMSAEALAPVRWSEPFESLREKAEGAKDARVFFANLATLAEFSTRSNFARNLFAVGGVAAIEPDTAYESASAMVAAFKASGAKAAVLCSTDSVYAEQAASTTRALKNAGCTWVALAGKPADEATLRAAGVDQFIFIGINALAELGRLHKALGL